MKLKNKIMHCSKQTYKKQSIGIMSVTSSIGSPTAVRTIAMVTRPAEGIPVAPMAAAVEVKLDKTLSNKCAVRLLLF